MTARAGIALAALLPFFSAARHDARKGAEEYRNKNFDAAQRQFESAASKEPSDPAWKFDLGTARAARGQGDARGPLRQAADSPGDPSLSAAALYQLGTLELREKNYSQAVSLLRKSLELDPLPADTKRNFEIALKNARKQQSPPPQGGGNKPPEKPPEKKNDASEFQQKAGLTPQEAEALLRALDAEQSRREKPAARIVGKDW